MTVKVHEIKNLLAKGLFAKKVIISGTQRKFVILDPYTNILDTLYPG